MAIVMRTFDQIGRIGSYNSPYLISDGKFD